MKSRSTYLWIELIDPSHSFFDTPIFDGSSNVHSLLDLGVINIVRQTSLSSEFFGSDGKAFNEEVLEYESVHIPALVSSVHDHGT
jgi:hypothetical protein